LAYILAITTTEVVGLLALKT